MHSPSTLRVVITDHRDPKFGLNGMPGSFGSVPVQWIPHQLENAPEEDVIRACLGADIVVVDLIRMTGSIIRQLDGTRLIIRHGAGYDNVDVAAATEKSIVVTYVPDYCTEDVAEHAIAMMLACARKIQPLGHCVQRKIWSHEPAVPIHRLSEMTVGIIGCGRIGSRVVDRLTGFNLRILVCDPYLDKRRESELGMRLVSLDSLLSRSDMVTIHAPLTEETRHMIGFRELASMKPGAFLINTARGAIVDNPSLERALASKTIAGAALDVFEPEPPFGMTGLLSMDNVLVTPHSAWYSEESVVEINQKIMEEIALFADGKPARYPVNPIVYGKKQ